MVTPGRSSELNIHHTIGAIGIPSKPHDGNCVAKVSSDIIMVANRGDVSLLVLLDLSATFDTVDHGIPRQRLHASHHITGLASGARLVQDVNR